MAVQKIRLKQYLLDNCLDFLDSEYSEYIAKAYERMRDQFEIMELPKNRNSSKDEYNDMVLRELDCAVIQYLHEEIDELIKFDNKLRNYSSYKRFFYPSRKRVTK